MLLDIKDLKIYFKSESGISKAVDRVSFQVEEEKTVCLVGESGCGKSVTSLGIMRLLDEKTIEKLSGEINFNGENLLLKTEDEMRKVRGNDISMIFQEPMTSLNPALKVGYQISEVYRTHFNMSKKEAKEKAIEMIKKVEIQNAEKVYNFYPHELSGGMRQRIMIAMAIAPEPKLIICDEPTTALDVTIQKEVLDLLKKLKDDLKTSSIFITHDLSVVKEISDFVNVMYSGEIVESASRDDIFKNPLHPYTKGLMKSIPKISGKNERLYTIKGSVPNPVDVKDNCHFCDRCEYAMDICFKEEPKNIEIERGHFVKCFLYHR